ncbi:MULTISPECIES: SDR family NAD(P)-dependent oxidoreductase [Paenibacillus]|uniref:Short-chain dehydrogenase n=1 Tax=Paenibacillus campinasensis TaxID=66347 RepID=A0A268EMS5_9BACL|nr:MULTISPECIES: SDR family oxidoreductase [Paenibacillus]PAD74413.1 short-chain dehydrogenase [Paenibacillus campinasensis]PAK50810.1 short-chain dehydrogenase [Paenibacillus sp. 7541]
MGTAGAQGTEKVALVTGAGAGIGRGIVKILAEKGYRLAMTYNSSKDGIVDVAEDIRHIYGKEPLIIQSDLTVRSEAENTIRKTVEAFDRIDLVVNNAGVGIHKPLTEMDEEDVDMQVNLDFRAPMLLSKYAAAEMIARDIPGNIIFITSSRGERAYPKDSIYGGMKAALIRAAQSLALEWAPHGIRVNCVAPGATVHKLEQSAEEEPLGSKIPLGRLGTPSDIGEAIAWLSSDAASYITGINLRIDGGLILPGMPEDTSPEAGYGWGEMTPTSDGDRA